MTALKQELAGEMAGVEGNLALGEPHTFFCLDKACSGACSSHSQP